MWETVRGKKKTKKVASGRTPQEERPVESERIHRARDESAEKMVRRNTPRMEAVTISETKEGATYASIMKEIVSSVKPSEIGVEIQAVRSTRTKLQKGKGNA